MVGAVVSVCLAVGVLAWWAVGDVPDDGIPADQLDHALGPYRVPLVVELVVGAVIRALGLAALGWLAAESVRRRVSPRWWIVVSLGALAAASASGAWRVITAGVIGANIGAGALLLVAPVVGLALVVGAVAVAVRTAAKAT